MATKAKCPVCREPVVRGAPCFPFCSSRCRGADLGSWLGGNYRIEAPPGDDDVEALVEALTRPGTPSA